MIRALAALLLLSAACLRDRRPTQERGAAGVFDQAPEVKGPPVDRCAAHGKSSVRGSCDEARTLGQVYTRKLSTGEQVCLEGGYGEEPGAACLARAAVVDTDMGRLLLEIRDARPESKWFQRVQYQVWFEEGALVDLYLSERGY